MHGLPGILTIIQAKKITKAVQYDPPIPWINTCFFKFNLIESSLKSVDKTLPTVDYIL